jgi:predicted nucleic acid-binding protein
VIVVDTNVFSETLRSAPDEKVMRWLAANADEIMTTAITVSELRFGALRLPEGQRRSEILAAVDALVGMAGARVVAFDSAAAAHSAALQARREAVGRVVSVEDTMIAAICLAGNHVLATRNVRDFDDSGVELINPWDEAL